MMIIEEVAGIHGGDGKGSRKWIKSSLGVKY